MIAKDIFKLAKLDGDVKNIISLVENFKIFQNQDFKDKLSKANFEFEPFNCCDIPW
ncbi:hypothetical protein [Mycoplasmopsis bovirhinis]|uniref:hypothetical protein n=1 Tax=Mycoplasmopsis bovirhinis TaxID=29553 RepID=UPI0012FDECD5|nr:hypothetical protein [Mycoplasmopsis bovirhinis]